MVKTTIEYERAGKGCFGRVLLRKRTSIGYYSSTLMFASLHRSIDLFSSYEKGVMVVSVKEFQIYAVYISDDVRDSDDRSHHAWINHGVFNHQICTKSGSCDIFRLEPT